jgi:inhibitor of cysteine peptidase
VIYIFLTVKWRWLERVLDLGDGEGIYSSRFIGEKGYIVTFRDVDPFYILDLSNPKKPEVKGEIKIPGYPSYLHSFSENYLLGIVAGESKVTLSLFDLSDIENPKENDTYILNEYWSDILVTHRAFMVNPEKEIFFMPGSFGGYIFSYKNGKFELLESVRAEVIRRALFVDSNLYIIGDSGILVLDDSSWNKVNELKFSENK